MVKRLVIGMSGASGAPLTVELLRQLHDQHPEVETHLIVTHGAQLKLFSVFALSPACGGYILYTQELGRYLPPRHFLSELV